MTLKQIIVEKITSGKFLFTITCALVFAYLSVKGILPADKVYDIILIVVYAYFTKKSEETKGEGK
jgi:hypothetical protein